jgi:Mg-chelatase subunit ChlD
MMPKLLWISAMMVLLPCGADTVHEEEQCVAGDCEAKEGLINPAGAQAMLSTKSAKGSSAFAERDTYECKDAKAAVDLVFLVDCSGSVTASGHAASKTFVKNVVAGLPVGTGSLDTRVAVVQFSDNKWTEIDLNSGTSEQAVVNAVNGMSYPGGKTHTHTAISYADTNTFAQARTDAQKLLAVIADGGCSSCDPKSAADTARANGVDIVAIGVGNGISYSELQKIAGPGGTILQTSQYSTLNNIVDDTTQTVCEKVDPTPAPTPVPTPEPTPEPTPVPTPEPTKPTYCEPHGTVDNDVHNDMPLCGNGELSWSCMPDKGGRVACPAHIPYMCAKKSCDGGQDHCCETDCGSPEGPYGGLKPGCD